MEPTPDFPIPRAILRRFSHPLEQQELLKVWPRIQAEGWSQSALKTYLTALQNKPELYQDHPLLGELALCLLRDRWNYIEPSDLPRWPDRSSGKRGIPEARRLPISVHGAVLPGRQAGLGLPVGAVLATRGAVIPRAVGRDLGCRVHLSIFPQASLTRLRESGLSDLQRRARPWVRFGLGHDSWAAPSEHPVFDDPAWQQNPVLLRARDRTRKRFGSSGTGNHFIDVGEVMLSATTSEFPSEGRFVAILTHHGSRGLGEDVTEFYHRLARQKCRELPRELKDWAWLSLDTAQGQEYWEAMELCQRITEASHRWLHTQLAEALDLGPSWTHTSPHNFARIELWRDEPVVVHRKGAIRLGSREFGVICGSQTAPTRLVLGTSSDEALHTVSHGLGREMSRGTARRAYRKKANVEAFREAQVRVVHHQPDEWPGVYQDQAAALQAHDGLIVSVGEFTPKIVWMCHLNDPSED